MWTAIDSDFKNPPLGDFPRDTTTKTFPLPAEIPDAAKEILVYVRVFVGGQSYPQRDWHYKVFVNVDKGKHEAAFYLYTHTDPNILNENCINSDNVWLPMPRDRTLRVKRISETADATPITGDYFYSALRVVAYR